MCFVTVYVDHMHKSDHNLLLVHSAEPPFVSSQRMFFFKVTFCINANFYPAHPWTCNTIIRNMFCLLKLILKRSFFFFLEAMYMSGELWEQMLAAEKDKVKQLEEKFAERMRAAKVRVVLNV